MIGKYLSQYRDFQYISALEIQDYQLLQLKKILTHAYQNSEYYKISFKQAGIHPAELKSLDDLNKFPFLTKNDLATKKKLIATKSNSLMASQKTTGGSTGQAVTLLKNTDALARERAATWTAYEWAGISIGDPQARFWGNPLYKSQLLKYKAIDMIANRMRLSAFEVRDSQLEIYYRKLFRFKPTYLYGYVSIIERFAKFVEENNYSLPSSIKCVITTSEVLTSSIRQTIEKAFQVKVYNEYGCGEVGSIAHECEYGNMHIMEENLICEVETSPKNPEEGEIVITDLYNYATPLIRYRLGDFASLSNNKCACGRSLKIIGNIHGRAYDCIITKDGNSFHPELVMYIFEHLKQRTDSISQFQVIQESLDSILVKIVKSSNYDSTVENYIANEFKKRLSPTIVTKFEHVDFIEREKSGKLRLVKSNVSELHG
jgi:phenylacetate-CoA ligase